MIKFLGLLRSLLSYSLFLISHSLKPMNYVIFSHNYVTNVFPDILTFVFSKPVYGSNYEIRHSKDHVLDIAGYTMKDFS
jgi:hypothetical protein